MIDFDHVLDAINSVTQNSEKYVIGNHFTGQSSLSLADWATFLSFKEDKNVAQSANDKLLWPVKMIANNIFFRILSLQN